jgi:hypothetical protein
MTRRRIALAVLVWCLWLLTVPASERYMSVDEIKPGMVGVGRTVFEGETIADFKVHILGVLRNTIAPQRNLILARLEGGPLAKTGVIAGMSGSPVYIDGRMIGAVSYSLGSFSTEPIAGITPIGEMLAASRLTTSPPAITPVAVPSVITADTWWRAIQARVEPRSPFAGSAAQIRVVHAGSFDPNVATALRPIATPISLGGLPDAMESPLLDTLARAGFVATPTAGGGPWQGSATPAATLRPGDPIGVTLAQGDFNVGATGTVTEVTGTTVYAFGHPFYGLGPTRLPMTRAFVHTILPSLMSSTKLASLGSVIGTFTQDRSTVLAGTLGSGPDMIPMSLALVQPDGKRRVVTCAIIDSPLLTPLLGYVAVGSTISAFERDLGRGTYAVRARIEVRGQTPVEFDDVFAGDGMTAAMASSLAIRLAALVTNDIEKVIIDSVSMEITPTETVDQSFIERVWLDVVDVVPGRPLPIKILLRHHRGATEVRTVMAEVPLYARGPLTLVVADGARLAQYEQRDGASGATPSSLPQLVSQLNRIRGNNRIYVRLYARAAGAVLGSDILPALPNSVLAVIEGDRAASGTTPLNSALMGTWDVPVAVAISGMRTLTVTPTSPTRLP